jgi:hypothetical protein
MKAILISAMIAGAIIYAIGASAEPRYPECAFSASCTSSSDMVACQKAKAADIAGGEDVSWVICTPEDVKRLDEWLAKCVGTEI